MGGTVADWLERWALRLTCLNRARPLLRYRLDEYTKSHLVLMSHTKDRFHVIPVISKQYIYSVPRILFHDVERQPVWSRCRSNPRARWWKYNGLPDPESSPSTLTFDARPKRPPYEVKHRAFVVVHLTFTGSVELRYEFLLFLFPS
jgi:hypothetical protein